jgi:hypothetical protein
MLILLSGQDVGNEVVPVEEPPASKYIQNVKDRGGVGLLKLLLYNHGAQFSKPLQGTPRTLWGIQP